MLEKDSVLNSAKFDGKLKGIPEMDSSLESAHYIWIRQDWLDKLGLEGPKTMQDLLKISEAFTTKDPDGNGKNDTYGVVAQKTFIQVGAERKVSFAGYRAYPNLWIEKW